MTATWKMMKLCKRCREQLGFYTKSSASIEEVDDTECAWWLHDEVRELLGKLKDWGAV